VAPLFNGRLKLRAFRSLTVLFVALAVGQRPVVASRVGQLKYLFSWLLKHGHSTIDSSHRKNAEGGSAAGGRTLDPISLTGDTRRHTGRISMQTNTVLVCGAGIAGPTLAYWPKRAGFAPTLLERAPALRSSGYVIDFWGLGYDIAEKMGLLPSLLNEGYHVRELRAVDGHGQCVSGFGTKVFDELTAGRFVSVKRSDLSRLIFEKIADDCEVLFGDTVKAIDQEQDGTRVSFEREKERQFDLVVGADGLHSAIRRIAFGPQENYEKRLGYTVAAFEVSSYRPRDEDMYVIYERPGRQIGRFALRGDRTLFLFVLAHDIGEHSYPRDATAQKAFLRNAFADDEWELPQILVALDSCAELYFDRVSQIKMDAWSRGRIVLIGDAAFCVSLLAGQGSALAMTAAYVLAEELDRANGDYGAAFRRYEELLRPYIIGKQKAAARFASSFAPKTQLGLTIRHFVMNGFRIPLVAKLVIGRDLVVDQLKLPHYSF
jgi:2-polyprenyl-6-methoxyphenol hydroxylase-like FAD-dependent oxidoreductase